LVQEECVGDVELFKDVGAPNTWLERKGITDREGSVGEERSGTLFVVQPSAFCEEGKEMFP
jgi:hypothetical protein